MAPSFWWNCLCRFAGSILVMKQSLVSGFAGSTLVIKQSKKLVNCCWYRDIRHLRWRHQCKQGVLFGVDFIYLFLHLVVAARKPMGNLPWAMQRSILIGLGNKTTTWRPCGQTEASRMHCNNKSMAGRWRICCFSKSASKYLYKAPSHPTVLHYQCYANHSMGSTMCRQ